MCVCVFVFQAPRHDTALRHTNHASLILSPVVVLHESGSHSVCTDEYVVYIHEARKGEEKKFFFFFVWLETCIRQ